MVRHRQPAPDDGREVQVQPEAKEAPVVTPMAVADTTPAKKTARTDVKYAIAPEDYSDWIFGGSFVAAALLGVRNGINTIRHNFYESFVKPPGTRPTNGTEVTHPFADLFKARSEYYIGAERKLKSGLIDGVAFTKEKLAITKDFGTKVEERLLKKFDIPSRGLQGWTKGLYKRWQHNGEFSRVGATLTMATTTVVTLGAIATLKYTKHLLDRIDQNEKQQEAFSAAATNDNMPRANDNAPGAKVREVQHSVLQQPDSGQVR